MGTLRRIKGISFHSTLTNDRNFRRILKSNFPGTAFPPPALPHPPPPEAAASEAPKGLEMFFLQRAKALQQANPALKALADLQGRAKEMLMGDFSHN